MCCHLHQAHKPPRAPDLELPAFSSLDFSIHNICLSIWRVSLQIKSYSKFCPPLDVIAWCMLKPLDWLDLLDSVCWLLTLGGSSSIISSLPTSLRMLDNQYLLELLHNRASLLIFIGWAHTSSIFIILLVKCIFYPGVFPKLVRYTRIFSPGIVILGVPGVK
jgi:hypothetical protein